MRTKMNIGKNRIRKLNIKQVHINECGEREDLILKVMQIIHNACLELK